jgi:uncharacterized protein (TIGR02996 family)
VSEEAAFHAQMAADPSDDTTRLVYADWLDEHDRPEQAARLRWSIGLRRHIRARRGQGYDGDTNSGTGVLSTLPNWVGRIAEHELVNHYLGEKAIADNNLRAEARRKLALAERYALGLSDDLEREYGRSSGDLGDPNSVHPQYRDAAGAVNRLLHPDIKVLGVSPSTAAVWHSRGRADISGSVERTHLLNHVKDYVKANPPPVGTPRGPTKLAAIEPADRPGSSVLVKVPVPQPVPAANTSAPAQPIKQQSALSAKAPVFFLPQ